MIAPEPQPKRPVEATCCYHCGDPLPGHPIMWADKSFCCQGCQTVFQILDEANMGTYYQLETHPGTAPRQHAVDYSFLDNTEIAEQLTDYADASQRRLSFSLPAIHCSSCIWLLERLPHFATGIQHVRVDFLRKKAYVVFQPEQISLRQVAEQLAQLGYPPEIQLDQGEEQPPKRNSHRFYLRLGVAGFAFGNIMLMSFPEYLGLGLEGQAFTRFFGALNILLSLPVVLFSAVPFYTGAWTGLRRGYMTIDLPITLGILALFGRSLYEILVASSAGYMDSLAALVFLLLAGRWFQNRSYDHLAFDRDYKAYFPLAATRLTPAGSESVRITALEAGDRLRVRHGELVPGDALLESEAGMLDYSFITGESEPVGVEAGMKLYAGGRVMGQALTLHLLKPVSRSYLTQLWNHESFQEDRTVRISALTDLLSRRFTVGVLSVAVIAGLYWWITAGAGTAVHVFTSVLIVACPCALALTIPILLGHTLRLLGKKGVYLRHTDVIEHLSHISHIVFDKTGTLSQTRDKQALEVQGILAPAAQARLGQLASQSTHPTSRALQARYLGTRTLAMTAFSEQPGSGIQAEIAGRHCHLGRADWLRERGINVPACQTGYTWYAEDGRALAGFRLGASYRPGLQGLLQRLGQRYPLALLSGDHDTEKETLQPWFPADSPLHFEQRPADKRTFIAKLQETGARVLMIGDGLNDAGALRQSDVGVSLTEGSQTFTPACDLILEGENFALIPELLALSRRSMRWVKGGLIISLAYNLVGLTIAVQGLLSPLIAAILMPLSSITIVLYGILSSQYATQRIFKAVPQERL